MRHEAPSRERRESSSCPPTLRAPAPGRDTFHRPGWFSRPACARWPPSRATSPTAFCLRSRGRRCRCRRRRSLPRRPEALMTAAAKPVGSGAIGATARPDTTGSAVSEAPADHSRLLTATKSIDMKRRFIKALRWSPCAVSSTRWHDRSRNPGRSSSRPSPHAHRRDT